MGQEQTEMTIWDHIEELRRSILWAVIALAVASAFSFLFAEKFITYLAQPIGGLVKLQAIDVTENVGVYMRVSLLGGVVLSMPMIVYQILNFILPGLLPSERKWIFISLPAATLLFLCGAAFSFYIMLPAAIPFMTGFLNIKTVVTISNYIAFVTNFLFWIGIGFETPLIIFVLAKFRIVHWRMLMEQWRFAIVIIAVIAAMVTPTVDPVNMGLMMAPLFLLYLISILLARFAIKDVKS
jgi:sec-independent protein translocase protein TatC